MTARLVLDVGGTKMAAAVVAEDHSIVDRAVLRTPVAADAETLYDAAVFVLHAALAVAAVPVDALGVGCGGPMRWPSGEVSPLNIPGWRDFPLRDRLAEEFGLPTRLSNDAVCLTVGEYVLGNSRSVGNCMGMLVSTGVGAGLIIDGRLVMGASGNAGHIGHVVVEPDGPECRCGGRGCLEAVARGPALVQWAVAQGWRPPADGEADAVRLAESARAGDAVATAAFRRCGEAVGTALAGAVALLDLRTVALGGGVSRAADLLMPAVYDAFERHAGLEFVRRCRVVLASPDAGLVGAAALFDDPWWPAVTDLLEQRSTGADHEVRSPLP